MNNYQDFKNLNNNVEKEIERKAKCLLPYIKQLEIIYDEEDEEEEPEIVNPETISYFINEQFYQAVTFYVMKGEFNENDWEEEDKNDPESYYHEAKAKHDPEDEYYPLFTICFFENDGIMQICSYEIYSYIVCDLEPLMELKINIKKERIGNLLKDL